ncbi:MAG: hypothetical protein ACOYKZ_03520 [Chlamydiia bacterium]
MRKKLLLSIGFSLGASALTAITAGWTGRPQEHVLLDPRTEDERAQTAQHVTQPRGDTQRQALVRQILDALEDTHPEQLAWKEVDALRQDLCQTREQAARMEKQHRALIQQLRSEYQVLGNEKIERQNRIEQLERMISLLNQQIADRSRELSDLQFSGQFKEDSLLSVIRKHQMQNSQLDAEASSLRDKVAQLTTALATVQSQQQTQTETISALHEKIVQLAKQHRTSLDQNDRLAGKMRELEQQRTNLQLSLAALQENRAGLEAEREQLQTDLAQVRKDSLQKAQELQELQSSLNEAIAERATHQRRADLAEAAQQTALAISKLPLQETSVLPMLERLAAHRVTLASGALSQEESPIVQHAQEALTLALVAARDSHARSQEALADKLAAQQALSETAQKLKIAETQVAHLTELRGRLADLAQQHIRLAGDSAYSHAHAGMLERELSESKAFLSSTQDLLAKGLFGSGSGAHLPGFISKSQSGASSVSSHGSDQAAIALSLGLQPPSSTRAEGYVPPRAGPTPWQSLVQKAPKAHEWSLHPIESLLAALPAVPTERSEFSELQHACNDISSELQQVLRGSLLPELESLLSSIEKELASCVEAQNVDDSAKAQLGGLNLRMHHAAQICSYVTSQVASNLTSTIDHLKSLNQTIADRQASLEEGDLAYQAAVQQMSQYLQQAHQDVAKAVARESALNRSVGDAVSMELARDERIHELQAMLDAKAESIQAFSRIAEDFRGELAARDVHHKELSAQIAALEETLSAERIEKDRLLALGDRLRFELQAKGSMLQELARQLESQKQATAIARSGIEILDRTVEEQRVAFQEFQEAAQRSEHGELTDRSNKISQLSSQLSELRATYEAVRTAYRAALSQSDELWCRLASLHEQRSADAAQTIRLQSLLGSTAADPSFHHGEPPLSNKPTREEIEATNERMRSMEIALEHARSTSRALQLSMEQLSTDSEQKAARIQTLTENLASAVARYGQEHAEVGTLRTHLTRAQETAQQLVQEQQDLKQQLALWEEQHWEERLQEAQKEASRLQVELAAAQHAGANIDSMLAAKEQELRQEITQQQALAQQAHERVQELSTRLEQTQQTAGAQVAQLTQELEGKHQQIATLQRQTALQMERLQDVEERYRSLHEGLTGLKTPNLPSIVQHLEERLEATHKALMLSEQAQTEARRGARELQANLAAASAQLEEARRVAQERIESLSTECASQAALAQRLKDALDIQLAQYSALQEQNQTLVALEQERVGAWNGKVSTLQEQLEREQAESRRLHALKEQQHATDQAQIETLQLQLTTKVQELGEARRDAASLTSRLTADRAAIQAQLSAVQGQLSGQAAELDSLHREEQRLRQELALVQSQNLPAQLAQLQEQLQLVSAERQHFAEAHKLSTQQAVALREDLAKTRELLAHTQRETSRVLAPLGAELAHAQQKAKAEQALHEEQLAELSALLQSKGEELAAREQQCATLAAVRATDLERLASLEHVQNELMDMQRSLSNVQASYLQKESQVKQLEEQLAMAQTQMIQAREDWDRQMAHREKELHQELARIQNSVLQTEQTQQEREKELHAAMAQDRADFQQELARLQMALVQTQQERQEREAVASQLAAELTLAQARVQVLDEEQAKLDRLLHEESQGIATRTREMETQYQQMLAGLNSERDSLAVSVSDLSLQLGQAKQRLQSSDQQTQSYLAQIQQYRASLETLHDQLQELIERDSQKASDLETAKRQLADQQNKLHLAYEQSLEYSEKFAQQDLEIQRLKKNLHEPSAGPSYAQLELRHAEVVGQLDQLKTLLQERERRAAQEESSRLTEIAKLRNQLEYVQHQTQDLEGDRTTLRSELIAAQEQLYRLAEQRRAMQAQLQDAVHQQEALAQQGEHWQRTAHEAAQEQQSLHQKVSELARELAARQQILEEDDRQRRVLEQALVRERSQVTLLEARLGAVSTPLQPVPLPLTADRSGNAPSLHPSLVQYGDPQSRNFDSSYNKSASERRRLHLVKQGETFRDIAQQYYGDTKEADKVRAANVRLLEGQNEPATGLVVTIP